MFAFDQAFGGRTEFGFYFPALVARVILIVNLLSVNYLIGRHSQMMPQIGMLNVKLHHRVMHLV